MERSNLIALVVITALCIGLLITGGQRSVAYKRAADAELALSNTQAQLDMERRLRAADQAATASVTKKLTALKAQKGKTDAQMQQALKADSDWADRPVPDGVRAALRVRSATD